MARYRLKYCLKGPINPKQPTKISVVWSDTESVLSVEASTLKSADLQRKWGWSGGAMVLGKLPVPERPTI